MPIYETTKTFEYKIKVRAPSGLQALAAADTWPVEEYPEGGCTELDLDEIDDQLWTADLDAAQVDHDMLRDNMQELGREWSLAGEEERDAWAFPEEGE